MIWIVLVAFIVVLAIILVAMVKPKLAAQDSGSHDDLSSPSNPELAAASADNTEVQMASTSSVDTSPPSGYEYEVFLSFRGSDTRKIFTDSLYHGLVDAGVRTFRDDECLRAGKEIGGNLLKAIGESKIYLPIFSKDYATSKWCLKELTCMLEHKNKGNSHMILPVFYDVTPSEVQDQTGDYGRALQKHKEEYSPEIVEQWKAALNEVGHLKGMDLLKLANGYEGQFKKLIVSKVLGELKKAHQIVTDDLVGIDDHVKTVKQLLQVGTDGVRILGIWGMGGIGKSTLAKVIYNQILSVFEGCSFLKEIRETSQQKGLEYLQSSLVGDLSSGEWRPEFSSVGEGIHQLKYRHRGKKVLVVLDDIDNTKQLDALVISHDSFGPGSRIIVTTRDKDTLKGYNVDDVYEVKAMNPDQSLELFYRHALRRTSPLDELSSLSRNIVDTTGGLPLAIEVIGSLLYGKSKMIWKETLEKLKVMLNKEVQDTLRVSYEVLDHEEKQIFLDIACFFIGVDMSTIFPMWEDCKFFPEIGIDVLIAKSLIKIVDYNKIWMHDQVRDLGREIVRQGNYMEPGKRSRLWDREEAKDVFANEMGSSNVEAICCHPDPNQHFTSEQLKNLPNLRLLDLGCNVSLAGDFKNLLPSLRWFKWMKSSFGSLTDLNLSNLVFLEMSNTELSADWNGWNSTQMVKLKILNLSSPCLNEIPDFTVFPNLEVLDLSYCERLQGIHRSIGNLKNLTCLDIRHCLRVKNLPPQLGSLEKLEILDASCCSALQSVPTLPASLIRLDISSCWSLAALPDLSNLKRLKSLNTHFCRRLGQLVGLDQLFALERLKISNCMSIKKLPSLSNLKLLKYLDAEGSLALKELVGLSELHALRELNILSCTELKGLPDLSKLGLLVVKS